MDKQPFACGSELLKQTSVLDAIYWISSAWDEVDESTILKCFQRCGFNLPSENNINSVNEDDDENHINEHDDDQDDDIPLAAIKFSREIFGCEFQELVEIDKNVCTCDTSLIDWEKPGSDLLQNIQCDSDDSDGDDDTANEKDVHVQPMLKSEATDMIEKLKQYAKQIGSAKLFDYFSKSEDELNSLSLKQCIQTDIADFLVERPQS